MIENIINLVEQVDNKTAAAHLIAKEFKISFHTARQTWLGKRPVLPQDEQLQSRYVEILQNIIAQQNQDKEKAVSE